MDYKKYVEIYKNDESDRYNRLPTPKIAIEISQKIYGKPIPGTKEHYDAFLMKIADKYDLTDNQVEKLLNELGKHERWERINYS